MKMKLDRNFRLETNAFHRTRRKYLKPLNSMTSSRMLILWIALTLTNLVSMHEKFKRPNIIRSIGKSSLLETG